MLVVAWLIVGVPAAWGVTQTVKQSLKLFYQPVATRTSPPATQPIMSPATQSATHPAVL